MSYRFEGFEKYLPLILALPVGTYFDTEVSELKVQASGDDVSTIRAAFPGQIWKKVPPAKHDWWEYHTTTPDGIKIIIYADRRGPLSCKKIETKITIMEEIEVPVTTRKEMREVTKTVVSWECPETP